MKNKITKWWDLTSNVNLYTSKINIDDPAQPEQDQFASWFGKVNNTFKLPKNFSFQLTAVYNSKTVLPPGGSVRRRWYGNDVWWSFIILHKDFKLGVFFFFVFFQSINADIGDTNMKFLKKTRLRLYFT
jgi:hypothetical protein